MKDQSTDGGPVVSGIKRIASAAKSKAGVGLAIVAVVVVLILLFS